MTLSDAAPQAVPGWPALGNGHVSPNELSLVHDAHLLVALILPLEHVPIFCGAGAST